MVKAISGTFNNNIGAKDVNDCEPCPENGVCSEGLLLNLDESIPVSISATNITTTPTKIKTPTNITKPKTNIVKPASITISTNITKPTNITTPIKNPTNITKPTNNTTSTNITTTPIKIKTPTNITKPKTNITTPTNNTISTNMTTPTNIKTPTNITITTNSKTPTNNTAPINITNSTTPTNNTTPSTTTTTTSSSPPTSTMSTTTTPTKTTEVAEDGFCGPCTSFATFINKDAEKFCQDDNGKCWYVLDCSGGGKVCKNAKKKTKTPTLTPKESDDHLKKTKKEILLQQLKNLKLQEQILNHQLQKLLNSEDQQKQREEIENKLKDVKSNISNTENEISALELESNNRKSENGDGMPTKQQIIIGSSIAGGLALIAACAGIGYYAKTHQATTAATTDAQSTQDFNSKAEIEQPAYDTNIIDGFQSNIDAQLRALG
eukprot:Pgem_evm1s4609